MSLPICAEQPGWVCRHVGSADVQLRAKTLRAWCLTDLPAGAQAANCEAEEDKRQLVNG